MAWIDGLFNNYEIQLWNGNTGNATRKKIAQIKNRDVFINQFMLKVQDALDMRYHFEGLTDTMSERVMLQSLLWYGCVCVFEKDGALMTLPCTADGSGYNIYGDLASVWVFARNGKLNEQVRCYVHGSDESAFLDETSGTQPNGKYKGVCIWENSTRYPFINQVIFYANAIADSMRTLDVCRKNIKNPYIITAEQSIIPTIKSYFDHRDNNEEFIVSSGIFPADRVNILPLAENSDSLSAITSLIEWYEAKFRELCGVNNNSQMDKKGENLIQAEVSVNDEYTQMSVDKIIPYIQLGLDDVNKLFGTNIRVVKNEVAVSENDDIMEGEEEDKNDERDADIQ